MDGGMVGISNTGFPVRVAYGVDNFSLPIPDPERRGKRFCLLEYLSFSSQMINFSKKSFSSKCEAILMVLETPASYTENFGILAPGDDIAGIKIF